jgi:hypothetical protein
MTLDAEVATVKTANRERASFSDCGGTLRTLSRFGQSIAASTALKHVISHHDRNRAKSDALF